MDDACVASFGNWTLHPATDRMRLSGPKAYCLFRGMRFFHLRGQSSLQLLVLALEERRSKLVISYQSIRTNRPEDSNLLIFEVLTVVRVVIPVFWDVTSCCLVDRQQPFGGLHCLSRYLSIKVRGATSRSLRSLWVTSAQCNLWINRVFRINYRPW
jgi:hypothetical protein